MSSIFFIDDRVQDKEALFSAFYTSAKWFVLDSSLDGISQMQKILSSYRDLDSIQIISHGGTGAINIGSTVLNSTTLSDYQTQLQDIDASLKETGDLLLYAGDIAIGDEGQKFISDLAKVTGADVTASNDLNDRLILDSNLPLETSTVLIETITIEPAVFSNELATRTIEESSMNGTLSSQSGNESNSQGDGDELIGTESAYTDSAGNTSNTKYQTSTDADSNITGYTHITTGTDSSGNSYSSTNHYDANWSVTESAYTDTAEANFGIDANNDGIIGALSSVDSSGSVNLSVDSLGNIFAGNVAVKTDSSQQIHTGIYGTEWTALAAETIGDVNTVLWQHESGALHTWQTDANWQWVSSDGWWGFGSTEFDTAEANFGIDANNDGIIGALSLVELDVSETIEKEIVPVISVCWFEEDLHQFDESLSYLIPKDNEFFVATDENFTLRRSSEEFTLDTLHVDAIHTTLTSDLGNGQTRDAGNDLLIFNSTTASNIDSIMDFVSTADNIQLNSFILSNSEMTESLSANLLWLETGSVKNQFSSDQTINSSEADPPYYDACGSGSGEVVEITILGVQSHPLIAYSDFTVTP